MFRLRGTVLNSAPVGMASIAFAEGPSGTRFIDQERLRKTVKLIVDGRRAGAISRSDIVRALSNVMALDDVVGLWRGEAGYIWFIEVDAISTADTLVQHMNFMASGERLIKAMYYDWQEVMVRLHWVPGFVDSNWVTILMSRYGKVKSVERETINVDGLCVETGERRVYLYVSEKQRLSMPHLIKCDDGVTCLLTMKGRSPMCLKCGNEGHTRVSCPGQVRETAASRALPPTYATAHLSSSRTLRGPMAQRVASTVTDAMIGFSAQCL